MQHLQIPRLLEAYRVHGLGFGFRVTSGLGTWVRAAVRVVACGGLGFGICGLGSIVVGP